MFPRARRAGRRRLLSLIGSILILSGLLPAAAAAPVLAAPTELFISEYVEGTSNNKAVEIYNGTGGAVDLTGYSLQMFFNGATTPLLVLDLVGTLDNDDVYIVANSGASAPILALANLLNGAGWFNGDDAVALAKNGTPIDVIGQIGFDPGTEWGTGLTSTADNTLRRKPSIQAGDANGGDAFDPAAQWDGFATDTFDGLGSHSITTDAAPQVTATSPANGATGVPTNTALSVTFSEPVALGTDAVTLSCSAQGSKVLTLSDPSGPSTFNYTTSTFQTADHCTLRVIAARVTDVDSDDPPDTMAADFSATFDIVGGVTSPLVINELDYDQVGTDTSEYFELKNTGTSAVNLDAYNVLLVNGNAGGALIYDTIDLPDAVLAAGDYFVVCANAGTVPNCDFDDGPDTDFIQNGGTDAVGLRNGSTLVDALSYEGNTAAPYTETAGTTAADSNTIGDIGLSRCLDGTDTNNNNADFQLRAITPGARNTCPGEDAAPTVSSTFPVNGATDVDVSANLSVTFSEAVIVTDPWFTLTCNLITKPATYSGGPTSFTIDPAGDFVDGDVCELTILAGAVADQDAIDPPDNMTVDFVVGFTAQDVCLDTFTPIHLIQGSGAATPIPGPVTTQGVVTGAFDNTGGIGGFYIQDPIGDGDPTTSDGIFVFTNNANTVSAGELVRVSGIAQERFNQTAITAGGTPPAPIPAGSVVVCGEADAPDPVEVTMPFEFLGFQERYEGMLVTFPQPLVISEFFNYDQFGEIVLALPLAGEARPFTGTALDEPGADANARTLANQLRRITLDDNQGGSNPAVLRHPNGDPFSLTNRFRGGDTVASATGVLGFDFSLYRIFPTAPADYTEVNPRPPARDDVGGTLTAAAMNTLNFFITPDYPNMPPNPLDNDCGPANNVECRGHDADQPLEFTRQRDKLLQALAGLDAEIIGLNELENSTGVDPLLDPTGIVPGLNAMPGVGPYAAIETGVIGTDAIRVGLIYRSDVVAPVGDFAILDSSVDPRFVDTRSRPVLAQTFEDLATGARITVAVNHLKSKGSGCADIGDPDLGDGQGNCNQTRKAAAQALVDWLATDPTGSGDRDYLILGDLNSYAREDPIDAIKAGPDDVPGTADDYTNLIESYLGDEAYSFVFDGQSGYLDHALASPTLAAQVTGATEWHINADEPDAVDYDTSFKPPSQESLYEPNAFRASDHDPVIVGLDLLNYEFSGFEDPIDNPPVLNIVKAGQGVPVKFQLADGLGLDVLFGTPSATQFACEGGGESDVLEETTTSGASGLQLDPQTGLYTYVWKTDKLWANQCRTFEITFDDGAYRRALFSFTK
ncbi:MAG TPA: ExeM/NucH family extracellular endonuclease [Candidatus Limnocylindrales bacterium]|nr:ExeM/NucH family extracellular endonuclease [Candidatus Limnocylindrales bacterium]